MKILQQPGTSIPEYFRLKHCNNPRTRNLKLANRGAATISVYEKQIGGVKKWAERDRKNVLSRLVSTLIDELEGDFENKKSSVWKNWRSNWLSAEGLSSDWRNNRRDKPAFHVAMSQIEDELIQS